MHDILVLLALIFYLPKVKSFSSPYTRPILAFIAIAALSLIFSFRPLNQIIVGSLYLWRWLAYALIYFVARQAKLPLRRYLIITGLIVAITGLIQYFLFPDTRFLYNLGWDEHYYRLIGTFFDPNFTGIFLVLTLILLWPSPVSIVPFVALLLTYSRSSYLAFLVIIVFHLRRRKLLLLVACSLWLVALLSLPRPGGEGVKLERLFSITNRLDSMQQGLRLFTQHPVFGVGFNLLRYQQNNLVSHSGAGIDNSFIFLLATTGLPGLLAYLWLLKRQLKSNAYFLVPILVHSLFNNTLFYAPVMLWLWLLLASDG